MQTDWKRSATSELVGRLSPIDGWFSDEAVGHFCLLLGYQNAAGIKGDLLEIGVYHGRSAVVLASYLKGKERLHLVDTFMAENGYREPYQIPGDAESVWANLQELNPGITRDQVEFHVTRSDSLILDDAQTFRFIHIDGGHRMSEALGDLHLVADHLSPKGVIAVDDYTNADWPEVTDAVDAFLLEDPRYYVVADPSMQQNRKLYVGKR